MQFEKRPVNPRAAAINRRAEQTANRFVRGIDRARRRLRMGGRRADYDDERYEFIGGANDPMRKKHYDKSLRLLWKAEQHLPWTSFRDCTPAERALRDLALQNMTEAERAQHDRITSDEFRALLDREYTPRQKRAIVSILSAIGHGEAYAWLVAADTLRDVKSTGAKSAVTMQVVEEAKHFVVMRELVEAFDVGVPRLSAWEYVLLERILKADGLEKFFGMNVLVETIALSIFGLFAHYPGLDVLRMFHLDESRHTALPGNYFKEFPMSRWQKHNPRARLRRLRMALPAIPLILYMEEDLAELGIDVFDFAGSVLRKVIVLSEKSGFDLPLSSEVLLGALNRLFNLYARRTRDGHRFRNFMTADTSIDAEVAKVEREIFEGAAA